MEEKNTFIRDLTQGSVTKQLLSFSAPFMLAQLLQTVYSMVDMYFIGNYVGSSALSGVSTGSELLMLVTFIGIGLASAGQVMISQFVGRGDRDSIRTTIGTMFTFILSVSLVLTVICLLMTPLMLQWMNTPETAYDSARGYVIVCFSGLFFIFGYNTVSAIFRGMGDSKRPLLFIGIAAVINMILDYVFVVKMDMAAAGAALATVIGQGFSFIASLVYLRRRRDAFGFDFRLSGFRPVASILKPMCKLGLPMILQSAAVSLSMLFVNSFINSYGVVASAVTGIGTKLGNVVSIIAGSVMTAGSSMIGQNLAANKHDRVRKIVHVSHAFTLSFAAVLSLIFLLMPKTVFSIFSQDPEVLAQASTYMAAGVISYFAFALMCPYNALITGIGYSTLAFVIGILDGVVARVGLSVLLGLVFDMGVVGFWYGNSLAGYVTVLLGAAYYLSGRWKTRKLIVDE